MEYPYEGLGMGREGLLWGNRRRYGMDGRVGGMGWGAMAICKAVIYRD